MNLGWLILLFYIWQRHLFKPIKLQQNKHQLVSGDQILFSPENKNPVQKFAEFASVHQQLTHPTASLPLELHPLIEFF